MPIGQRNVQTSLCDKCGSEFFSELGEPICGYFVSILKVTTEKSVVAELYACSDACVPNAILDGISREELSEVERNAAIQALRRRGSRGKPKVVAGEGSALQQLEKDIF